MWLVFCLVSSQVSIQVAGPGPRWLPSTNVSRFSISPLSPRHVDNPYDPIPERPTTRIASASFISKCYLGRVDFLRLVHRSRHLSPLLFSLKSPSLRLPTGELVTKVFFISSSTSSTKLPTLSCPQVSGSSYTWDGVTWHTATYTARNKVLVAMFKTLFVSSHDAFKKVLPYGKHCQRHNGPESWVQLTKVHTL